ncbi:MAG: DinB family protein [Hymenobacteraceae bacterium]|nr:DinB family protein [Hymenobacteraceae bacterium]
MITRTWHGRTKAADAEIFFRYLNKVAVEDYRNTAGNLGVQIRRATEGDVTHFWVDSQWDSVDSIKAFAGEEYGQAKYYDESSRFLLELEPTVTHCETTAYGPDRRLADLVRQFEQLYDGELWLDETLLKKLTGIDAADSVVQPFPELHSLQQVVLHLINWRKLLVARLRGNFDFKIELNSAADWLPPGMLDPERWSVILSDLDETQQELISLLQQQEDSILDTRVGPFEYTYQYLIEGLIHHDLYHLGQIGLIRKLVKLQSPQE